MENAFVAALADVINVPVSLGSVIVLSAVGSTTVNVVSCASAVAPSNTILASVNANCVAVSVVIVGEFIVGLVKVLLVKVSVPVNDTNESPERAELNCEREPDIVFEPNAIVLFVNVSVELVITIVPLASGIVIVLSAVGSVIAKTVS